MPWARRESRPLLAIVAAKVSVLGYGAIAAAVAGVAVWPLREALSIWDRFDVVYYLRIAEHGYSASITDRDLAFFPFFPGAIALVSLVFRDPLLSGFIVSTVASIVAVLALYRLAARDETASASLRSVGYFLIFPTSFVLHIPYTEGLFLALALPAFLAARDGRWFTASSLGALAACTRVNGLVLVPALAAEAYVAYKRGGRVSRSWAWLALVPLGTIAFLLTNQVVAGDPLRFIALDRIYWDKGLDWPWVGAMRLLSWTAQPSESPVGSIGAIVELIFIGSSLVATVAVGRLMRASYTVWMLGNVFLFASVSVPQSVPRYALLLFPAFFLLGRIPPGRWTLGVVIVSVGALCLLAGRFVVGLWAF